MQFPVLAFFVILITKSGKRKLGKSRILWEAANRELQLKFAEIKNISDFLDLDELKELRQALFTNDTAKVDEMGLLDLTGIGYGATSKTIKTKEMHLVNGGKVEDVVQAEFVVRISGNQDYQGNGINNGYFAYVDEFTLNDAASNSIVGGKRRFRP